MIVMGGAPNMAPSDLFSPDRIRLADIDGSGTTDLLYVGGDGVHVWLNQAGNSSPKATIAYGRASGADHDEQEKSWLPATEQAFYHVTDELAWYRHGVPKEARAFEIGTGLTTSASGLFDVATILDAKTNWTRLAFDDADFATTDERLRLLSHTRERYWNDAVTAPLDYGAALPSKALPYESYGMAFTSAMLTVRLENDVDETLATTGRGRCGA